MKQLDSMYDRIFEDKKLQKLFLNFHIKNWGKLSVEQKQKIIKEMNGRVASLYGYEVCKIKKIKTNHYGAQNSFTWEINLSETMLETSSGYEVLDTYFHELKHAFQTRAIQNRLTDKEHVEENDRKKWQANFLPSNYFGGDSPYYQYQAVEQDAWVTGLLFTRRIYFMNKLAIPDIDPTWQEYWKGCRLRE